MKKYILTITIIAILLSCDITENRFIYIENHSNQNIISFISKKDMNKMSAITESDSGADVKTNNFGTINPVRIRWEQYFKSCEDGKIRIYIIKEDSIIKYSMANILKKNIYNKKYLYSIEDLEKINWKIKYK